MRRFSLRFVLLLLFGLLLYACRNEPGPVRLAPGVTAADYRTFFIQAVRAEGHRIDFEERFDTAVRRALEAKGYRYQVEHGDLRVIYALGLQRQPGLEMRPVITQDGVFTQTQLTEDTEARLALRILDESNGRVLLESVLSRQLHDPALTQEAFDRGVAQLLKDFPSRSQPRMSQAVEVVLAALGVLAGRRQPGRPPLQPPQGGDPQGSHCAAEQQAEQVAVGLHPALDPGNQ